MCSLRDAADELEALGVRLFGISVDDVATLRRFAEEQELEFPLLSDPDGSAATRYGVLHPRPRVARRVTFLVDPQGVIRLVDREVAVRTHGADMVSRVRALQAEVGED